VSTNGDENELLRSVALQNANSILAARRRAERRSEAYLRKRKGSVIQVASAGSRPPGRSSWPEETFASFQ